MDEDGVKSLLVKEWRTRPGGASNSKSSLGWNSFSPSSRPHELLKESYSIQAVIPGGLTSLVQPLDFCLNKPLKDRLREKWTQWMINRKTTFNPARNKTTVSLATTWKLVKETWQKILTKWLPDPSRSAGSLKRWIGMKMTCSRKDGEIACVDDDKEAAAPYL